jgi:sterol desaturase/sphingolipid hydroxylase (fatty acid hydroxylase superfamily)
MSSIQAGDDARASDNAVQRTLDPIRAAVLTGFALYLGMICMAWWAAGRWAPDQVSFHLLGHLWSLSNLHRKLWSNGFELAVMFPAVLVIELLITGWPESSLRRLVVLRTPSTMSDWSCFVMWETKLMGLLIGLTTFGVALISASWVHDKVSAMTGLSPTMADWPTILQLPVLFLVFSFFDYWNHRLDHWRVFWPLHRFHHAADDFCVLTAGRTHPALFTGIITGVMPAVVLGASPAAIISLGLFASLLRYIIHSRVDSNFGWVGRYVVQSPNHHRLHHILDISTAPVGHFSLAPIWDHLFGTWRGDADQSLVIGVEAPYRHGAWVAPDMWRDYVEFWRGLWVALVRRKPAPSTVATSTPS